MISEPNTTPPPLVIPSNSSQARSQPWGLIITILIAIVATFCLVGLYLLWRLKKLSFVPGLFKRKPRNMNSYDTEANADPYATETELVPPRRPERSSQTRPNTTAKSHVDEQSHGYGIPPSSLPLHSWEPAVLAGAGVKSKARAYGGNATPNHGTPSQYGFREEATIEVMHDMDNPSSSDGSDSARVWTLASNSSRYTTPPLRSNTTGSSRAAFKTTYGQPQPSTGGSHEEHAGRRPHPVADPRGSSSTITVARHDTAPHPHAPVALHIAQNPSRSGTPTVERLTRSATTRSTSDSYREGSVNGYGATPVRHQRTGRDHGDGEFEDVDLGPERELHHSKTFPVGSGRYGDGRRL